MRQGLLSGPPQLSEKCQRCRAEGLSVIFAGPHLTRCIPAVQPQPGLQGWNHDDAYAVFPFGGWVGWSCAIRSGPIRLLQARTISSVSERIRPRLYRMTSNAEFWYSRSPASQATAVALPPTHFTRPAGEGKSAREALASAHLRNATRCYTGVASPRRSFRCVFGSVHIPQCLPEHGSHAMLPTD